MMREMNTARLQLRPLSPNDEALYLRIYTDPALMRLIAEPLTDAAARACFRRLVEGRAPRWRLWVMHETAARVDIGLVALVLAASPEVGADVGSMVLDGWQRRGYTVEALERLAMHAFDELRLPVLVGRHAGANPGSIGVLRTLGFARVPAVASDRFAGLDVRQELPLSAWRQRVGAAALSAPSPGTHAAADTQDLPQEHHLA